MDPAADLPACSFLAPNLDVDALVDLLDTRSGGNDLVRAARDVAARAHAEHRRDEGTPYLVHPLRIACGLAGLGADPVMLAAALCHDVFEDAGPDDARRVWELGPDVGELVEALTHDFYDDYFAKIVDAGPRACRVKLADRIDNLRFLHLTDLPKQVRYVRKTERDFPPLITTAESPELAGALDALIEWHRDRLLQASTDAPPPPAFGVWGPSLGAAPRPSTEDE